MKSNISPNTRAGVATPQPAASDRGNKSGNNGVKVSILGRDFYVACDEQQRESLDAAASFLDTQMRTIQQSGKVMGVERCAVMAALNMSYELLGLREQAGDAGQVRDRLRSMNDKIDSIMDETRQKTIEAG